MQPYESTEDEILMAIKAPLPVEYVSQSQDKLMVDVQMAPLDSNGDIMGLPTFNVNVCADSRCVLGLPEHLTGTSVAPDSISALGDCDVNIKKFSS